MKLCSVPFRSAVALSAATLFTGSILLTSASAPASASSQVLSTVQDEEAAEEEIVWSLSPADDDTGRVSFQFEVDPGGTVEDAVELTNYSNREITFEMIAADGIAGSSGAFDVLPPDVDSEAAGTWIELEQDEITVPSEETVEIPFTLAVPEDVTPGDHPAGIAAAVAADGDETVSMVSRVGTRIHLRVAGDIVPELAVQNIDVDYNQNWNPFAPGTATFTWSLHNDGNIRLSPLQALEYSGPFGIARDQARLDEINELHEILPGDTLQFSTTETVWPLFTVSSELTIDSELVGEDEVDADTVEPNAVSEQTTSAAIPIPQLIILVLLGLLIWLLVTRKTRQRKKFDTAVAAAAAQKVDQPDDTNETDGDAPHQR